ncbi:dual specificity protein phosphatase MPK-4-like isoform X2 [Oratosquilla oratoria]|uniref:dual specificity protein phosphatase MPK-4-like isoform X2 n=1 Tax=Oratosquilla oratoria TaxID=337810 RepID=UPI003F770265
MKIIVPYIHNHRCVHSCLLPTANSPQPVKQQQDSCSQLSHSQVRDGLLAAVMNFCQHHHQGNLSVAVDKTLLAKYRISHILTVESNPLPLEIRELPGMAFLYIQVDDMADRDLLSKFDEAAEFIADGQNKGCVYVHCFFGVSRSSTLVICYMMKKYGWTMDEALQRVKSRRKFTCPNPGFIAQLLLYQRMGNKLDPDCPQYRLYRLVKAARSFRESNLEGIVVPSPQADSQESDPIAVKCRKCRTPLVARSALLFHVQGQVPQWTDEILPECKEKVNFCRHGIFTFPVDWMQCVRSNIQGKLLCPKCFSKIGSFNWLTGCECPCRTKIVPAFYLVPSKVDFTF